MTSKTGNSFERIIENEIITNVTGLRSSDDQHLRSDNIYLLKPICHKIYEVIFYGSRPTKFSYSIPQNPPYQLVYGGTVLAQSHKKNDLAQLETTITGLFSDERLTRIKTQYENEKSNLHKLYHDLNSLKEKIQKICDRISAGNPKYESKERIWRKPKLQNYPVCDLCP